MILSNYHTHTNFVDGAHTPEEMVVSAIAQGMDTIGFSEHCYTPFDPDCSMTPEQTKQYQNEIARLQQKYAGQIQVLRGIEMDYTSQDDPSAYDYVIGSVHYLRVKGKTYAVDISAQGVKQCIQECFAGDHNAYAQAYYDLVAKVVEKTNAQIIGHFDLITKFSNRGVVFDETSPVYQAAWQNAMKQLAGKAVLEINTGAISRGYRTTPYPSPAMLRFWKELGGGVVINSDSHHKDTLLQSFHEAEQLALQQGFTKLGFTDRLGRYHKQSGGTK